MSKYNLGEAMLKALEGTSVIFFIIGLLVITVMCMAKGFIIGAIITAWVTLFISITALNYYIG